MYVFFIFHSSQYLLPDRNDGLSMLFQNCTKVASASEHVNENRSKYVLYFYFVLVNRNLKKQLLSVKQTSVI